MAVFTQLTEADIRQHLALYNIGGLISWRGIEEGDSNSNFLIETTQNRYILTIPEERRTDINALPYFVSLTEHLAEKTISCPAPIKNKDGKTITSIAGKPAIIAPFLEGRSTKIIGLSHIHALGESIAKMHLATESFSQHRANSMAMAEWKRLAYLVMPNADSITQGLASLIKNELDFLAQNWPAAAELPSGAVHLDLFPDNIFFTGEQGALTISGVIDFYFACDDFFMYDLAIAMNAWCFDAEHQFQPELAGALFSSYLAIRPISEDEKQALPTLARGAALRFLLTRSYDQLNPPEGATINLKDPAEYIKKLEFHQQVKSSASYKV